MVALAGGVVCAHAADATSRSRQKPNNLIFTVRPTSWKGEWNKPRRSLRQSSALENRNLRLILHVILDSRADLRLSAVREIGRCIRTNSSSQKLMKKCSSLSKLVAIHHFRTRAYHSAPHLSRVRRLHGHEVALPLVRIPAMPGGIPPCALRRVRYTVLLADHPSGSAPRLNHSAYFPARASNCAATVLPTLTRPSE